jgi:hypothetical protein
VSGRGNLRTLHDISFPPVPEFRSYPSESSQETSIAQRRWGGSQTQQFILVPLSAGEKRIPPLELVVFSPGEGAYRTLRSAPFDVTVTAGTGMEEGLPSVRGDIEVLGRDIRFIETEVPAFREMTGSLAAMRLWLLLLVLPALGHLGTWFWVRHRRRLGSDVAYRRRRNALRHARGVLARAGRAPAGERADLSGEAVRGYVADRFNLSRAGLTLTDVDRSLRGCGEDPGPVLRFLERSDAARYAPGSPDGTTDWAGEAARLLAALEKGR